jgi:DNA-binding NarL/FixJ family response regulator
VSRAEAMPPAFVALLRDLLDEVPRPAYLVAADGKILAANIHGYNDGAGPSPELRAAIAQAIRPGRHDARFRILPGKNLQLQQWVVIDDAAPIDPDAPALFVARRYQLTPQEQSVLVHRCRGLKRRAIAHALGCGPGTVHTHLVRIHAKLEVRSALELMRKVARMGRGG